MRLPLTRLGASLGAVALVVGIALATATGAGAHPEHGQPAHPNWQPVPDGVPMSYVVNTAPNHGQLQEAERAVAEAGGTVLQAWPQIGVIVAHS
ncbi:MAG TPA: hypothetical protein VE074_18285, partial [Jatrophihabitantaceae bacterium]|nr:hypothetical protein [Jatrophihabitantaceae bacterium]